MHDLNTLNRLNADAFNAAPTAARRAGKHVVTVREGLTLASFTQHDTDVEAQGQRVKLQAERAPGRTVQVFGPLDEPFARRDQSEDRAPAAGTLGEYIAQKA